MNITRDNYEAFFLDYIEGNLEEARIDEFLDFLEMNPDLKEELHLFENIQLPEDLSKFSGKEQLYRSPEEAKTSIEAKTIAYLEGDLDKEESSLFETYLAAHPELLKDYQLFAKTKLKPEPGLIFKGKNKLYKKSAAVVFMNWTARAAAVIVLLWGINSVIKTNLQPINENSEKVTAEITAKPDIQENKVVPEIKTLASIRPEKPKKSKDLQTEKIEVANALKNKTTEVVAPFESNPEVRENIILAEISPINTPLQRIPVELGLTVSRSIEEEKIIDQRNNNTTIEEYLAVRAQR